MSAALTKEDILTAVKHMSVMDVVQLIEMFEKEFNVTASVPMMAAAMPAAGASAEVEEQTEFNLVLKSFGKNKVEVIKVVRGLTSLGLKEAKDLVESAPNAMIKEAVSKAEAEEVRKQLEQAGAEVEIK